MADSFSMMECRLRNSNDSIMMNIMFLAMDRAHQKLNSRKGVIGRLIEISKFYELAVMQLDGCLRIVKEETDNLEVNHEEILYALYIVREKLQRRLDDTELAILNTDSCLAERLGYELKHSEALEMKEKEPGDLDQLQRTKSAVHHDTQKIPSNQVSRANNGKSGDISRCKNPADIRMFEERQFCVEYSQIDQLGSDIDRIKESLVLAFRKVQNALFLSEVEPADHKWRWSIQKDVMLISAKGLTEDFHDLYEPTLRKLNYFSLLMNEIRSLRTELYQLLREKETSVNPASSQTDCRVKVSMGTKKRPPVDGKKGKNDEHTKDEHADNVEEEGRNYVAKLISTHERIIRKKVEEQSAKERLIRERWYSAMRRDKQPDGLSKKIQDVIAILDGIINLNPDSDKYSVDLHEDNVKHMPLRRFSSESEIDIRNIASTMFSRVDEDLLGQVRILQREKEDSKIQSLIMQEVLAILLRAWMKQCHHEFDERIEQLFIKVRMLEQKSVNSKTESMMLEDSCWKIEKEKYELCKNIKILERANEDSLWQLTILEETYAALLTAFTKEYHEELHKMSSSKDLLEEIVYEFTKML